MSLVFVDVEANGISPFSGQMTEFGAVEWRSRETFHGVLWQSTPDPKNPARSLFSSTPSHLEIGQVMRDFEAWLNRVSKGRHVMVSDNPAYDFQWVNYYFDQHLGHNPFGHSARRISDFYAGLMRDFYQTQTWKKWRVTPHDHNPVHDAMGNVEAFEKILELAK